MGAVIETRAADLRVGDRVTAVYKPTAAARQPAGHRAGDPVRRGRFVGLVEHTVVSTEPEGDRIKVVGQYRTKRETYFLRATALVEVIR